MLFYLLWCGNFIRWNFSLKTWLDNIEIKIDFFDNIVICFFVCFVWFLGCLIFVIEGLPDINEKFEKEKS